MVKKVKDPSYNINLLLESVQKQCSQVDIDNQTNLSLLKTSGENYKEAIIKEVILRVCVSGGVSVRKWGLLQTIKMQNIKLKT